MYDRISWNNLQNNLPPEDRMTYEEYLAAITPDTSTVDTSTVDTSGTGIVTGYEYAEDAGILNTLLWEQQGFTGYSAPIEYDGGYRAPGEPCPPGFTMQPDGTCVWVSPPPNFVAKPPNFITTPPTFNVSPPPPPPPSFTPPPTRRNDVKTATPDIVQYNDELLPAEVIADLLFEDIGGQELLTIARSDTVNGQNVLYQPITNLGILQQQYNPNNIIKLQDTSDIIFSTYPIPLSLKIPNEGNGPNGETVYINDSGSLIIELVNMRDDEQVEVQISISGTIYEVDLG